MEESKKTYLVKYIEGCKRWLDRELDKEYDIVDDFFYDSNQGLFEEQGGFIISKIDTYDYQDTFQVNRVGCWYNDNLETDRYFASLNFEDQFHLATFSSSKK